MGPNLAYELEDHYATFIVRAFAIPLSWPNSSPVNLLDRERFRGDRCSWLELGSYSHWVLGNRDTEGRALPSRRIMAVLPQGVRSRNTKR